MLLDGLTFGDAFALARHELWLFAACFFLIGAFDELVVDLSYFWLRLTGRARTPRVDASHVEGVSLSGPCAVFIPAWQEHRVIAATIRHALTVWPQDGWRLYVGCYENDTATLEAAISGADGDPRVRLVLLDRAGPSCKADCLNRLFRALKEDETRSGATSRMVVLHDAEDLVDPAALSLLDQAIDHSDFVQLPVIALPQHGSPLIAGHYSDEFAEAHARAMVVRSALGQGIPGAGVGCAISRKWLDRLDARRAGTGPFATGALTEDYELGLSLAAMGARSRFLRVRTLDGRLIATRAFFPTTIRAAIRQKARWVHGIAFQGWDRLGWASSPPAIWMQLRDRRGPLAALLLALAYSLIVFEGVALVLRQFALVEEVQMSPTLAWLVWVNACMLGWRLVLRAIFTAREHGMREGLLAIPRIVISNTVAIVAARRALAAYVRSLVGGNAVVWEKTEHSHHPAIPGLRLEERRA